MPGMPQHLTVRRAHGPVLELFCTAVTTSTSFLLQGAITVRSADSEETRGPNETAAKGSVALSPKAILMPHASPTDDETRHQAERGVKRGAGEGDACSPGSPGLVIVSHDDVVVHQDAYHEDHHRHYPHEVSKKPGARLNATPVTLLQC